MTTSCELSEIEIKELQELKSGQNFQKGTFIFCELYTCWYNNLGQVLV